MRARDAARVDAVEIESGARLPAKNSFAARACGECRRLKPTVAVRASARPLLNGVELRVVERERLFDEHATPRSSARDASSACVSWRVRYDEVHVRVRQKPLRA